MCAAKGEDVTIPAGERKIGRCFPKWKQELLQYCKNSNEEEKQLVEEVIKAAKRIIRQNHKRKHSGIKKISKFIQ